MEENFPEIKKYVHVWAFVFFDLIKWTHSVPEKFNRKR